MLKRFFHGQIRRLESAYGYDAGYLHEVLDASMSAFVKFALFQTMSSHRQDVPADALYAAKIAATLSEDCGLCTQLVVDMALRQGVAARAIAALLRGDIDGAGADASLGFRYGIAVATNDPDAVTLAEKAEQRFGKRGLVSLAFAVTSSRVYPCLKRGLGHGIACTKITLAGQSIAVKQA